MPVLRPRSADWRRFAALVEGATAALAPADEPGLAVAVSIGAEVVWTHCTGLANLEFGMAIAGDTRFRIASISKQMVAAVVVMLAHEGRLSLDDALHAHLPEMAVFEPPITLRHLLTMTSGLHEVSHLGWLATGDQGSSQVSWPEWRRLVMSQRTPGFEAGSRYLYNNANYMLLQWVAEQATGATLSQLLRERVFAPLDMHDTLLPEHPARLPARLATGYQKAADGHFDAPIGWRNSGAAGGVMSTLDDMARWALNLCTNRLQPADLPQRLAEPCVHPNGRRSHYGLGVATGVHAGRRWLGHAGGLAGFSTDQIVFPDHELAITVLANRDDVKTMRLSRRIADHLIDGHSLLDRTNARTPHSLPDGLARHPGVYVSAEARRVVEIAVGPGLLTANGLLLDSTAPGVLRVLIGDEPVVYEVSATDTLVASYLSGARAVLRRTALAAPDASLLRELPGTYAVVALDARWRVVADEAGPGTGLRLRIDSPWRSADEFDLLQAAPDLLVMAVAGGAPQCNSVLEVERNAEGRITALVGHFDRSRRLRLERTASHSHAAPA